MFHLPDLEPYIPIVSMLTESDNRTKQAYSDSHHLRLISDTQTKVDSHLNQFHLTSNCSHTHLFSCLSSIAYIIIHKERENNKTQWLRKTPFC